MASTGKALDNDDVYELPMGDAEDAIPAEWRAFRAGHLYARTSGALPALR